jgi:hypothetical protein
VSAAKHRKKVLNPGHWDWEKHFHVQGYQDITSGVTAFNKNYSEEPAMPISNFSNYVMNQELYYEKTAGVSAKHFAML